MVYTPLPRHGGDDAVGVHLADAVVVVVSNIQVAGGIEGHAVRDTKAGVGGRAAIPGIAEPPLPATVVMMPLVSTLRMRLL